MLTIKTTVNEKRELQIDIPIPYYCKEISGDVVTFYGVMSENKLLTFRNDLIYPRISATVPSCYYPEIVRSEPISGNEFIEAFVSAQNQLSLIACVGAFSRNIGMEPADESIHSTK